MVCALSIARFNYEVRPELEVIVKKALRKKRDERYQSIHDVLIDLRDLERELDLTDSQAYSAPALQRGEVKTEILATPRGSSSNLPGPQTSSIQPHPTSSAEYLVSEIKRHKMGIGLIAAIVLVAVIGGGLVIYKLAGANKPTGPPAIAFTRLTNGGRLGNELILGGATISPDGKYVVFWTGDGDQTSCYVRQVSTNSVVKIAGPIESNSPGSTFSPDGEFVYFNTGGKLNPDGALFKVPVLGGTPQKILEGIWSPVSFSPDGKQVAYVRLFPSTGESWLVIANADGSGTPRTIAKRKLPEYYSQIGPAWSPDGKRIALGAQSVPEVGNATIVEVPVDGGSEHPITKPQWSQIFRVLWIQDGSGLVFAANSFLNSPGDQIWFLSYPDGLAHRITNDLNGYGQFSLGLTAD
jgi:eukaryotic-like serine/threonine-protein kinase